MSNMDYTLLVPDLDGLPEDFFAEPKNAEISNPERAELPPLEDDE